MPARLLNPKHHELGVGVIGGGGASSDSAVYYYILYYSYCLYCVAVP